MKCVFKKLANIPYLVSENNIIVEINNEFTSSYGYSENELIGKSLTEISRLIRIDSQKYLNDIENEYSCYMFTKEYEPREVTITCKNLQSKNRKTYFIEEKPNSRIEDILQHVFKLILDNEFGVAICSSESGIVLKVNQRNINFMNSGEKEIGDILGRTLEEILTKKEEYDFYDIFSNVMKEGKSFYKREMKFKHSKRGDIYLDITLVPICISGKVKYIVFTADEVTEKVKNRILNEKQKQELEAIIDNVSDIIIVFDKNGKYTMSNKAFRNKHSYNIVGLLLEDVFEKAQYLDINGDLITFENMPSKRVMSGEKFSGYRMDIKGNDYIFRGELSGTPIYDNDGNFIAGVIIDRDINERLKNEESLLIKKQFDLLNKIVENFELYIARYTYPELKIIHFNNKAYNQLKQLNPTIPNQNSIIGKSVYDITNENVSIIETIQNALKNDIYFKIKKYKVAEEEVFYKYICQPLYGLNNEILEIIVIGIDVTDQIQAKNKLEETLKTQDEIFANITHELKTPLNVIFSTNQLMELYLKKGLIEDNKKNLFKDISIIKQNCYRFTKLINNIVDLSKIDSGFYKLNLSNYNIVDIVENIVQSVVEYIKDKGLSIVFDTDIEEKIISCDPEKIERVILNLISNAIKFSYYKNEIYINIFDKEEFVEISIRDTGIGIDNEYLDLIFEKYRQIDKTFTRNAEGSGIGLSIVKSIVDLHGGKISVESEFGKGSTFKILLPAITIEHTKEIQLNEDINNKVSMINIEFSDIYH